MKNLILSTMLFMCIFVNIQAQNPSYTVTGKITNWPTDQVYLVRQGNHPGVDSTVVRNGVFEFKGTIAGPTSAYLITQRKGGTAKLLFVEPGDIAIEGDFSALKDVKITGSPTYQEFEKLKNGHEIFNQQMNQNVMLQLNTTDSLERESVLAAMEKIGLEDVEFSKNFIAEHPNSLASLIEIHSLMKSVDLGELRKLFDNLSDPLKESPEGKQLLYKLEGNSALVD